MAYNIGMGVLGGGGMGFAPNIMNSMFPNPAKAGMGYLNQIAGTMSPYYQPYMQAGQSAVGQLQNEYGNLLSNRGDIQSQLNQLMKNPQGFLSQMGAGYQQSPGYQFQLNQAMNAAQNQAAAGGMAGSPAAQQGAAEIATNLANQDYYNYLNHVLGLYGQGLQGEAGLYGAGLQGTAELGQLGQQSAQDLATSLAQALMSQGQMAYAGQANENKMLGDLLGNFLGGARTFAGF